MSVNTKALQFLLSFYRIGGKDLVGIFFFAKQKGQFSDPPPSRKKKAGMGGRGGRKAASLVSKELGGKSVSFTVDLVVFG